VIYSWVADEAGDSPIVSERGSRHQVIFGLGGMYFW